MAGCRAVSCPPAGLLQVVKQCVRVPVFVMIRPRGGDFLYSDREVEVMKADIRLAKLHGADGLVFGALTEDGRIDTELCTALLGKRVSSHKCCAELHAVSALGLGLEVQCCSVLVM